jgi:hypothetical protein
MKRRTGNAGKRAKFVYNTLLTSSEAKHFRGTNPPFIKDPHTTHPNKMEEDNDLADYNEEGNEKSETQQVLVEYWVPETMNYVAESTADIEQKLKLAGLKKLRGELLLNAKTDLDA